MDQPPVTREETPTNTKGEEVLTALYQKACEDRDQLAATNSMYAKMLEACAESNNIAEKAANTAKREAEEANDLAARAVEERDAAVLKLQKVESDSLAELVSVRAAASAAAAKDAERWAKAEEAHHDAMEKAAADLKQLTEENATLRRDLLEASSQAAFLPRLVTHQGNEIRGELSAKIATLSAEIAQLQKSSAAAEKVHLDAQAAANQQAEHLRNEIIDLKAQLLQEQNKRMAVESESATAIANVRKELAVEVEKCRRAEEAANEAFRVRDEINANAQSVVDEREAVYRAQLQEMSNARAACEEAFARSIADLTEKFSAAVSNTEKEKNQIFDQLTAVKQQLATTRDECRQLKADQANATIQKNEALKALRDSMLAENDKVVQLLESRNRELTTLEAMYTEALMKDKSREAEISNTRRSEERSAAAENQAQTVIATLKSNMAESDETIADLTAKITALQHSLTDAEQRLHNASLSTKQEVDNVADKTAQLQAEQQVELRRLEAAFAQEIAALTDQDRKSKQQLEADGNKMREIIAYNAEQVKRVEEIAAQLEATQKELMDLQGKVGDDIESGSPGRKRKRK